MGRNIILLLVLIGVAVTLQDGKKRCGVYLTRALAEICKGNYNPLRLHTKRSIEAYAKTPKMLPSNEKFPFLTRESAQAFTGQFRKRIIRGVVDECCHKSCNINELASYCAQ